MNTSEPVIVKIPVSEIRDWESFHTVFAKTLGFPSFYGRNMNAWVDCMDSIDCREDGMTSVHASEGGMLVMDLGICTDFAQRCPEQYEAILDSTGFVNHRRIDVGEKPVLALSFWNKEPLLTKKKTWVWWSSSR